jgi:hypothetical protein
MRRVRPSAILGVVLVFAGCGGGGRPAAKYRFAVMPKSLDLPVFNYARVGAERMARRLGPCCHHVGRRAASSHLLVIGYRYSAAHTAAARNR